jgi:hypothetical protein
MQLRASARFVNHLAADVPAEVDQNSSIGPLLETMLTGLLVSVVCARCGGRRTERMEIELAAQNQGGAWCRGEVQSAPAGSALEDRRQGR